MSRNQWRRLFSFLLLAGMLLSFVQPVNALGRTQDAKPLTSPKSQESASAQIDPVVQQEIAANGSTDFFVWLKEQADLSPAQSLKTKLEKGTFVFNTLQELANRTQKDLRAYLDQQGVSYKPFWIENKILVKGGTGDLLTAVAARSDVDRITANLRFQLVEPSQPVPADQPEFVEPNISFINADDVWAMGIDGNGTVVAGNDTGLDETHPAIARHYRGCLNPPDCTSWDHNYNWYDPTGTYPTDPYDGFGHGTHTTGTMVGDDGAGNQIGVAPGAKTIHCKLMDDGGYATYEWIDSCFQWDIAPTDLNGQNPDPSMAPDAVNNSWGWPGGGDNNNRGSTDALLAAGIVAEFSAGNEGSGCQTLRSPGDYSEVLTTGSVNHAGGVLPGTLTYFSSRGPSDLDSGFFPDVMAPGENIRSSLPGNQYAYWSGTSMAGPHVTALIGLLWSANPALRGQVDQTVQIIDDTAVRLVGQNGSNCGGDYTNGPNNDWGFGSIDALAAVQMAIAMGGSGELDGTVTDANTDLPIEGATVTAVHEDGYTWDDTTDASGFYSMTVAAGTFDVTAAHPNYVAVTVSGVQVITDTVTTQNFQLTPRGHLYGYVTDLENGFPLVGATVTADDGTSATTNNSGYYEMWLDPGTYVVTAHMQDYADESATVTVDYGSEVQQDFSLEAAVSFIPTPLTITLDYGSTGSVDATVLNNQNVPYFFEFKEKNNGFIPALNLGLANMNYPRGTAAPSAGPVPGAKQANPVNVGKMIQTLAGTPANAMELINAYLIYFETDNAAGYTNLFSEPGAFFAGDFINGDYSTLYAIDYNTNQLYSVDTATGAQTLIGPSVPVAGESWSGMTGASDGTMYAASTSINSSTLYTVDLATGATTVVGQITGANCVIDIAINSADDMYAHDICQDAIYSVDPNTGAGTFIGNTGFDANYAQGMDFDNESGILYLTDFDNASYNAELRSVDLTTGNTQLVGTFGYFVEVDSTGFQADIPPDVPWLAETPISATVPAESSLPVTIDFSATYGAGVYQPGDYLATLTLDGVDVDVKVPVTMTVNAPPTWGKIEGTVTGLGYCDANPAPLEGAVVTITSDSGLVYTLETDASGYYTYWLDETDSPYSVEVTYPDHETGFTSGVIITGGQTTTVDFDLRWLKPCMSVDPASMAVNLNLGEMVTLPMQLTNNGAGGTDWDITEQDEGYVPAAADTVLVVQYDTYDSDPMIAALNALGVPHYDVWYWDFETMSVDDLLGYLAVFYGGASDTASQTLMMAYLDAGGSLYIADNDVGWANGGTTFYQTYLQATYVLDDGGSIATGSDIMNGLVIDASGDPYPDGFTVGAEATQIFTWETGYAAGDLVDRNGYKAVYTSWDLYYASADNNTEMIDRILGVLGSADAVWLSENPASGTLGADSSTQVDVTFDANVVGQPGNYMALMKVNSDDPVNGRIEVPVTMTVNAPATFGLLEGTVTGLGYCDVNPIPLEEAVVLITSSTGMTWTVMTDATGHYAYWLDEGGSPYTVSVTFPDYEVGFEDNVIIVGQQTTVVDFDLRLLEPCLSVDPDSLAVTLDMGSQTTLPLTLSNSGAGDATFEATDQETGFIPAARGNPNPQATNARSEDKGAFPQIAATPVDNAEADVLLIEDTLPWGSSAIETILSNNGIVYDLINSSQISTWDFSPYRMIITPSVQDGWGFYANINANLAKFEDWIDNGGLMLMNVATQGELVNLPFGGSNPWNGQEYNYIIDPTYPIFAGVANPYYGSYASHNTISGLLGDDITLVTTGQSPGGEPVMIERYEGGGLLVAGGQTFEFGWQNGQDAGIILENMIPWYYNNFQGGGDALWLSENPTSGTVPANGGTQVVDVTFDAGVVGQPGDYLGKVRISSNDPVNDTIDVPVTMTVNAPLTYGKLDGTVTGLGYCDTDGGPLEGAVVVIESSSGMTWTVETDENGYYSYWLDEAGSPYSVTVTFPDYTTGFEDGIVIVGQQTTTVDVTLRWLVPCVSVAPDSLTANLNLGETDTQQFVITNDGAAAANFEITDNEDSYTPKLGKADMNYPRGDAAPSAGPVPGAKQANPVNVGKMIQALAGTPANAMELINLYLIYFDTENPAGYTNLFSEAGAFFAGDFINGDFSTLYAIDYNSNTLYAIDTATGAQTAIGPSVPVAGESWSGMTGAADGTMYAASTSIFGSTLYTIDLDTGEATVVGQITGADCVIDIAITPAGDMYAHDICQDAIFSVDPATGAGTFIGYTGFDANYAQGMDYDEGAGILYLTSFDNATYNAELRSVDVETGNTQVIGTFGYFIEVDSTGFLVGGGGGDAIWLTEDPTSGSVPPDGGTTTVDVTFDAGVVTQPGTYEGTIKVKTDDPVNKTAEITATMNVAAPPNYGRIEGVVSSLGYCDENPAPLAGATVLVQSSTGMTWTLTTDETGTYGLWVPQEGSPYTISVTADDHEPGFVDGINVVGGQVTTVNIDLRVLAPCVSVEPLSFNVQMKLNDTETHELILTNSGAEAAEFSIRERPASRGLGFTNPNPQFSEPAAVGPMSVRSAQGQSALGTAQANVPLAWTNASPLPMVDVRYAHAQCAEEPDSFYVIGGVSNGNIINNAWRYDAETDTWTTLASIPMGQEGMTAVCYDGLVYVLGGGGTNQFYIYDPASDSWSTGPSLPRLVWGSAAGAFDGYLYMIGGDSDFYFGGTSSEVDIYDIANGTWSTGTSMPGPAVTPAYTQAGNYVYVVGGWNDNYPSNSNVTQRYDMSSDTWEVGPTFTAARADGAAAITVDGLFAIGGDADGGTPFDASTAVDVLDWTAWPGGAWTSVGDPLPVGLTANNAGFCTNAVTGGEIWSVGGIDIGFVWHDYNQYRPSGACFAGGSTDIPWLSENPTEGIVEADSTAVVDVIFDTTVLTHTGVYTGTLRVTTGDPEVGTINVPVTLTVVEPVYGVTLAPDTAAASGAPGETVDYTLSLTNDGNVQDTFDLSATSVNGWAVSFAVNPVTVDPGMSVDVVVHVTIPADAANGATDDEVITATSQGDPTKSDSSTLTTTVVVPINAAVQLEPSEAAASGVFGETVEYELTLTNLGPDEDTITLSAAGNDWNVTFSGTVFTLASGESVDVDVYVTIPYGLNDGDTDVVTVTATSGLDPSVSDFSVLTTTAKTIQIFLPIIFLR